MRDDDDRTRCTRDDRCETRPVMRRARERAGMRDARAREGGGDSTGLDRTELDTNERTNDD